MNKLDIFFAKKGVKVINLAKILGSKTFLSKLRPDMSKDNIQMFTYKLQQPISY